MFLFNLLIQLKISIAGWVVPFGNLRINVCLPLPEAYRSLPRPSSATNAKASAMYPYYLDTFTFISTKCIMCFINRISILSKNYNLFLKIIIFFMCTEHSRVFPTKYFLQNHHRFNPDPASCTLFGADRDRTCDILLAKQTLSQLSYSPKAGA